MNKKDILNLMEAYDEVTSNEVNSSEVTPTPPEETPSANSANLETSIDNITDAVKKVDEGDVVDLIPFISDLIRKAKSLIGKA